MTVRHYAGGPPEKRALAAWACAWDGVYPWLVLDIATLHHRQRGRCYLCIGRFERGHRSRDDMCWSKDHVFPQAAGGRREANVLLAHRGCNHRKANRWPHPCEVIYLASVYAHPFDAVVERLRRIAHRLLRANRRRYAIERANA